MNGFLLPLFVEADEDVVQNQGHRLDLLGKGHGQADAYGQINLVAQAAAPLLFRDTPLRAVDGVELAAVKAGLEGVAALGHEVEVISGLADN